jgi:Na+-translocating ferredoxin:NAD+ oxidoreductase RNF subunit RnfB
MKEILIPAVIVAGMGLILGLVLAVASKLMAVKKDETVEAIEAILPGANCGACGFSGCSGYAENLAKGDCKTNLCQPGGNEVAGKIAEILGTESEEVIPLRATVLCKGTCDNVKDKMEYKGLKSCLAANSLSAGKSNCKYGCIGFGDCVKSCDRGAISICNGVAVIDRDLCGGCANCVTACPKGIIKVIPADAPKAAVFCKNEDKGPVAKQTCNASCIGCRICEKKCEFEAIKVDGFLASVDPEKCTGCGVCVSSCPRKCIEIL